MTKARRIGLLNSGNNPHDIVVRVEFLGHTYNVNRNQIKGKTEQELNTALQNWLDFNEPGEVMFVHIHRDGTFCIATDRLPAVWPEDEVQP